MGLAKPTPQKFFFSFSSKNGIFQCLLRHRLTQTKEKSKEGLLGDASASMARLHVYGTNRHRPYSTQLFC